METRRKMCDVLEMANPEFIPEYTVSDYLLWEGDWELWNGIPVSMSPSPNFRHQKIGSRIFGEIHRQLSKDPCDNQCLAIYEIDWHVDDKTVVRPDILVLCEEPEGDFVESAPTLIAEILSPSTRKKDLTSKRELYASKGVKYYLIFDPEEDKAQFLKLEDGTWREISTGSELDIDENCSVKLVVADMF